MVKVPVGPEPLPISQAPHKRDSSDDITDTRGRYNSCVHCVAGLAAKQLNLERMRETFYHVLEVEALSTGPGDSIRRKDQELFHTLGQDYF